MWIRIKDQMPLMDRTTILATQDGTLLGELTGWQTSEDEPVWFINGSLWDGDEGYEPYWWYVVPEVPEESKSYWTVQEDK